MHLRSEAKDSDGSQRGMQAQRVSFLSFRDAHSQGFLFISDLWLEGCPYRGLASLQQLTLLSVCGTGQVRREKPTLLPPLEELFLGVVTETLAEAFGTHPFPPTRSCNLGQWWKWRGRKTKPNPDISSVILDIPFQSVAFLVFCSG